MFRSVIASFAVASLLLLSTSAYGGYKEHMAKHGKKYKWVAIGAAVWYGWKHHCGHNPSSRICLNEDRQVHKPKISNQQPRKECHTPGCRK